MKRIWKIAAVLLAVSDGLVLYDYVALKKDLREFDAEMAAKLILWF